MSKPTNKREPCKLNEKEKETSSKTVVWCVRCPSRTAWQVHRRVAQHSPSRNPFTLHTHHGDTYTPQQASNQAKPSRTTHTRSTNNSTKPLIPAPVRLSGHAAHPPNSYCTLRLFRSFHSIQGHLCQTCCFNQMLVPTTDIRKVDSIHTVLYWWWRNTKSFAIGRKETSINSSSCVRCLVYALAAHRCRPEQPIPHQPTANQFMQKNTQQKQHHSRRHLPRCARAVAPPLQIFLQLLLLPFSSFPANCLPIQQNGKAEYDPCCSPHSPAVPWPHCSSTQQHIQTNAQTLKNMLLLSPSPSPLPCLGDVKTNKQKGTLQAK